MIEELGSREYLALSIMSLALAGIRIISALALFVVFDSFARELVLIVVDWIIFIIPFIVMGVGLLIVHLQAKKGCMNEKWVKFIYKAMLVRGSRTVFHMVLVGLVAFCLLLKAFTIYSLGYNSEFVVALFISIAVLIVSVYGVVASLRYMQGFGNLVEKIASVSSYSKKKRNILLMRYITAVMGLLKQDIFR